MNYSTIKEMYDNLLDLDIETTKEERSELFDLLDTQNDFTWEADGSEYRIISENVIEEVHQDEIREFVEENYVDSNLWWIEIDWERTAENVRQADGYGHHFATYDGNEQEFELNKEWFHVFRIN